MLPAAFDPVSWHAHEFLFGYLGAIIGGFSADRGAALDGAPAIVGGREGVLAGL
jgi:uncharacterized protein involved in response to NO